MGDSIEFKGRIGYLNSVIRSRSATDSERIAKYDISFDSIDDLCALLNMDPDEIVIVGDERMPYSRFKSEVLEKTHRIYPIKDGKLLDMVEAGMDKLEELVGRKIR
jgi:hypothetical protein